MNSPARKCWLAVYSRWLSHEAKPWRGGIAFRPGMLFYLLSNQSYVGKVVHKEVVHEGEHEVIVPQELY